MLSHIAYTIILLGIQLAIIEPEQGSEQDNLADSLRFLRDYNQLKEAAPREESALTGIAHRSDASLAGLALELDGGGTVSLLLNKSDERRLRDRMSASQALRVRVVGELRSILGPANANEHRQIIVLSVSRWFEIAEPHATEPADLPPPFVRVFPPWQTFWIKQRDDQAVPNTDARVRIKTGDVTKGQVQVSITADHDTVLLDAVSMKPGDKQAFEIGGQACTLELLKLDNSVIRDYARFRLVAGPLPKSATAPSR